MDFPVQILPPSDYPQPLSEIPQSPKQLYNRGATIDTTKRLIAFVGARRHSDYAKKACESIIAKLAPYPITIVSGLAIGIDAIAHRAALQAGLTTIAVTGSGLNDEVIYPAVNRSLAQEILTSNGTLLSELPPTAQATKYTFPSRNRIMAGLCELVIAVECEMKSGTRITTRLATEYNKEVGAVPHGIFSEVGAGTNALIQQGAHIICGADDILSLLDMDTVTQDNTRLETLTDNEKTIYKALTSPKTRTVLAEETTMPVHTLQATLALLEMKNLITETLGTIHRQ